MRLDVVVPTYNRRELLERTLASLLSQTAPPPSLEVAVIVVDNNSTDDTPSLVQNMSERFGHRLRYVFEPRQGRSHALNAGIASSDAELLGIIDDDEEISATWYQRVFQAFENAELDFAGGPYVPRWGAEPPAWLPKNYPGIVGIITAGDAPLPYDDRFPGILMGGNAVFRRRLLDRVGPYPTDLGRTGGHLLAGEDEEMYRRLRRIGARGMYYPDLAIYHYIPVVRLTKRYHRSWCFWASVSWSIVHRRHPQPVVYWAGVPRYLYGTAMRGLVRMVKGVGTRAAPAEVFSAELPLWELAGFIYGRHVYQRVRRENRGSVS